jgi:hypothetical protein
MAVKYLSGNRVTALSTDLISASGTNRLGTTDATPTLSDDFSSDSWVDNDSASIGVSSGAMNWKSDESNTSNDASTYDLGVGNVSDTQWILRFEFKVVTKGTVGGGNGLSVGLGDSDQSVSSTTSQDWIGWNWNYDNTEKYLASDSDNASMPQVWDGDGSQAFTFTTGTIYYVEVIRSSDTVYTTEVFTNSDYSTGSQGKITGACVSTNGSHRYIRVTNMANSSGAGGTDGKIEDVKFYNGITAITTDNAVTVPNGSVAEETDTGKHKIWNSTTSAWVEVG